MTFFPSSHDRELELLSAYLDNQLGPAERARLEYRLAQEPKLKATLDDLRSVKTTLTALPKVKPPRNFTLTLKQLEARGLAAPARPPIRLFALVNVATALAAVLFAVLITADLGGSFNLATPAEAPAAQVESLQVAEAPAAEAQAVESASADAALKSTTETPEAGVSMLAPPVEAEPLTGAPGEGGGGGGGPGVGGEGVGTTNTGPAADAGGGVPAGVTGTVEPTVATPEAVAQAAITETPTPDSSRTRAATEVPLETQEATETLAQTPPAVRVAEIALGLTVILLIVVSLIIRRK
jgi:anti-sigma factor RsiW